ncbi:MAG: ABC transporter substrate-binding protein [Acidimicrobiales bacterium]
MTLQSHSSSSVCNGTPTSGGDLVYARGTSTETLDPLDILNGNGDIFADNLIYQGLVGFDPKGKNEIVPLIAKSWTISPNGLLYTFHLRPGVKFSNGQPVTAQDVAWSLNQFGSPKSNIVMGVLAVGYGTARVVNSSTVTISLLHPVAAFLDDIASFPAFVVPQALVQKEGKAFWKNPVGSGPFKFQSFVSGSHVTFVKNPYYWDKPLPYLNKVTFDFALDSNSRLLDLESNEAQIADLITPSQIPTIQSNKKLVLAQHNIPAWVAIYPNVTYKPLSNVDVRLAIADAIDRKLLIKEIFHGIGTVPNDVMGQLKYDGNDSQVPPYKYDLKAAKKLMKEAGYAKGFKVTLQYPTGFDYFGQLTLLIKQELSAIGIDVTLVPLASATMTDNWSAMKYQLNFAFAITSSDIPVPDEYANFEADPTKSGLDGFFTGWKDPAIWTMVQKFTSTVSEASRAEQWPKIQEAFMQQQPAINLVDYPILTAHQTNVCGADLNVMGVDQLQDTWIASGK